tara:strand:+ start:2942 stop:3427 length:486 start_codon:yes stop_codon:yes gene_type:complete
MNLALIFGTGSNKSLADGTELSRAYISGDTTVIRGDIYTVQSISLTVTENFNLSAQDDNHDIYEISYNFDITPSIVLPDSSTISNGYKATLVNTNYLSIGVSVYDETNDKISSWGLTGITGNASSDGNSTWNTTAATTFTLPPHMAISLIYLNNKWYSSMN